MKNNYESRWLFTKKKVLLYFGGLNELRRVPFCPYLLSDLCEICIQ